MNNIVAKHVIKLFIVSLCIIPFLIIYFNAKTHVDEFAYNDNYYINNTMIGTKNVTYYSTSSSLIFIIAGGIISLLSLLNCHSRKIVASMFLLNV